MSLPLLALPDMPSVTMPEMNMGEYVPSVSMPSVTMPEMSMPSVSIPTVSMPEMSMPSVTLSPYEMNMSLPEMNMGEYVPSVSMPSVSMPEMSMSLPDMPSLPTALSSYNISTLSTTHPPPQPLSPSQLLHPHALNAQQSLVLSLKIKKLSSRQQYRLAVVHLLPMLQVLDFDEITMRERIIARNLTHQQVKCVMIIMHMLT